MGDERNIVGRLRQYEGRDWETTVCYNGLRDEAADKIAELLSANSTLAGIIDRLTGELERLRGNDPLAEGPQPLPIKYACKGCSHLETKWWKDHLDNDETDSGTSAWCNAGERRSITAYWHDTDAPPKWCPFLAQAEPPCVQEDHQ